MTEWRLRAGKRRVNRPAKRWKEQEQQKALISSARSKAVDVGDDDDDKRTPIEVCHLIAEDRNIWR